jgi:hypothetical protein
MQNSRISKSLVKFGCASAVLAALMFACLLDSIGDLRGVIVFVIIVLIFPITLLLGIDASKVIKREAPLGKSMRRLGWLLGFPQAVMGTILIAFGLVYPLFGIRELIDELSIGRMPILPIVRIGSAFLAFVLGQHYLREGLRSGSKD